MLGTLSHFNSVLMGILVIRWLIPDSSPWRWLNACAFGPLAGLSISSAILFVLMFLADGLSDLVLLWDILIPLAISLTVCLWLTKQPVNSSKQTISPSLRLGTLESVLIIATLAMVFLVYLESQFYRELRPNGWWDALMIWNLRARFFVNGTFGLAQQFQLDPLAHGDYPLMLPLTVSRMWAGNGAESVSASVLVQWTFFVPLMLLMLINTTIVSRTISIGLISLMTLLSASQISEQLTWLIADLPLASYFLATMVALNYGQNSALTPSSQDQWRWLTICGLMASSAAWMKNEGLVFLAIISLVIVVTSLRTTSLRSIGFPRLKAYIMGVVPITLTLLLFKTFLAPRSDLLSQQESLFTLITDFHRYEVIAYMLSFAVMNYFLPACVTLCLSAFVITTKNLRWNWELLISNSLILFMVSMAYLLAYLTTPHDIIWHVSTSLHRLLLQLWPLAVWIILTSRQPSQNSSPVPAEIPVPGH